MLHVGIWLIVPNRMLVFCGILISFAVLPFLEVLTEAGGSGKQKSERHDQDDKERRRAKARRKSTHDEDEGLFSCGVRQRRRALLRTERFVAAQPARPRASTSTGRRPPPKPGIPAGP